MTKRTGLCLLLAGCIGLISAHAVFATEMAPEDSLRPEKKAQLPMVPDFQLKNLQGERIALADLLGKGPILIDFWATWCKPCIKELPHLQELYDTYREQGFLVIAVSEDKPRSLSKVQSFIAGKKYDFLVLLDENNAVQRKFNFRALPYTVLLDKEGHMVHSSMGYRPGDEKVLEEKLLPLLCSREESEGDDEASSSVEDDDDEGNQGDVETGSSEDERRHGLYIKKVKSEEARKVEAEEQNE